MVDGDPESFMLEGTSGGVQAYMLLRERSVMGLKQVAQAFRQVGLKSSKDGHGTSSVGHLLHCLTVFMGKDIVFPCFS